jgi:hypothetical protein
MEGHEAIAAGDELPFSAAFGGSGNRLRICHSTSVTPECEQLHRAHTRGEYDSTRDATFDEPFYVGFDVGGFELGLQTSDEPPRTARMRTGWSTMGAL